MYPRSRGMSSEVFASRVWPEAQSCVLVRVDDRLVCCCPESSREVPALGFILSCFREITRGVKETQEKSIVFILLHFAHFRQIHRVEWVQHLFPFLTS